MSRPSGNCLGCGEWRKLLVGQECGACYNLRHGQGHRSYRPTRYYSRALPLQGRRNKRRDQRAQANMRPEA